MISFSLLTYLITGEALNTKTLICLALSFIIICVQIFWK
jgi:hypothetical protein